MSYRSASRPSCRRLTCNKSATYNIIHHFPEKANKFFSFQFKQSKKTDAAGTAKQQQSPPHRPFSSHTVCRTQSGMTIEQIMYARTPEPPMQANSTQITRTSVGSILKYSAIPPHTPQIFLLLHDLQSFFSFIIKIPFLKLIF